MSSTFYITIGLLMMTTQMILSAPTKTNLERSKKSMSYFDYIQHNTDTVGLNNDYYTYYEDNDLSRASPSRKKVSSSYESPIYYIRLPPQPYMFVPGFGYMSQPNQHNHLNDFLNLPVNFLSNGKPSNIYQWNAALDYENNRPKPTIATQNSNIHRLPGEFVFNGKPNDIYVLRDSYNSLYSDALQNFYP